MRVSARGAVASVLVGAAVIGGGFAAMSAQQQSHKEAFAAWYWDNQDRMDDCFGTVRVYVGYEGQNWSDDAMRQFTEPCYSVTELAGTDLAASYHQVGDALVARGDVLPAIEAAVQKVATHVEETV